jgi:hypothetical protein
MAKDRPRNGKDDRRGCDNGITKMPHILYAVKMSCADTAAREECVFMKYNYLHCRSQRFFVGGGGGGLI